MNSSGDFQISNSCVSNISKRQLLREKVNNLCRYLKEEFNGKKLRIIELEATCDEEVLIYIIQELVPYAGDLNKLVIKLCNQEGMKPTQQCFEKLKRYCQFFIEIVK